MLKVEYKIIGGLVYGNLWGGGQGAYECAKLEGYKSRAALMKDAKAALKDGTLDSGMGFDGLICALVSVERLETMEKGGKVWKARDVEAVELGEMSPKVRDFLYTLDN